MGEQSLFDSYRGLNTRDTVKLILDHIYQFLYIKFNRFEKWMLEEAD